MARILTYANDNSISDNDLLVGSNYISLNNYSTANFKLIDLARYFANFWIQDGSLYNFASLSQSITTNTTATEANATYSLNLAATFGTFDDEGNLQTLAESFANQVFSTTSSTTFATSSYVTNLGSSFGVFDADGNLTSLSESFANNVMTTTNNSRFAESTFVNNLGSSFGTLASDGSVTISEAFADSVITTTASDRFATTTSVDTLTSTVEGKPDIFRQDDAPATTNPVGSIWYDTNDNNKVYVLVSGTPNVWTETSDDRIVTNSQSISSVNQSVTTLSNTLGAEAALIDELQTQFTFDTNGGITGTADALATSITTASSNAAGAVASDLDKLEAVFTFDSNNDVSGVAGALNTSINTAASTASNAVATDLDKLEAVFSFDSNGDVDGIQGSLSTAVTSNANTAISNASLASASDVDELKTQFTFDSNDNITGVADALSTSISNTASSAAGAVATDLDKLEAVFTFDSNNNVDGIQGSLSTAVTSNANTAISNASLASAADVTELQSQFTFTNGNITGVTDALATSISTTASNAAGAVATDLDKLEAVFSFDGNGNVNGTAGALSTAVTSSANTAIADANLATAQSVTDLTSTVNTKPQIFRQASQPSTSGVPNNSLWYDTDDNNKLYVLISSTWTATVDGTIAIAQSAANTAQQTANSRPKVFRQNSAPATTEPASSIWYDTDDSNKIYILVGSTWTATDDPRIATNTANISTQQTAITRLDGHSKAAYSLTATANDVITGMRIIASDNTVDTVSEVKFQADKFIVNSASTNLTPFSISGSKIKFNGDIDVTGTALIQGTDTTANAFTALKIVNTGSNGKVGFKLQNNVGYFCEMFLNTGTYAGVSGYGIDLNLGTNSNTVAHFNAGGLCVPAGTSTSTYNGKSIFFNSDNAARDEDSGRIHVNNYMTTMFIDLPDGDATNGYGGHTNTRLMFREWDTGTNSDSFVAKIDNNDAWHLGTIYARNATTYLADLDNTGDSIKVAGDVVAYVSSDKRYKDNIVNISNPLNKLNKINGVSFTWNEISHKETGKKDIGVIAQEIEEVFPEIVETRENGYKAVDYPKLTALLIEAVKELNNKVKALEDGITK